MPNFKVSHRVIDDNKYIVSDLLISLLQTPEIEEGVSAVRQFYLSYGIEVIFAAVSSYEGSLPCEVDEKEYLMNLFGCLNVMLVGVRECCRQFHELKGCYLMISFICSKSPYAVSALKTMSNSMDTAAETAHKSNICEQVIQSNSLKYLFPILMGQGLKGRDTEEQ
jgi:hypothetical protein